MMSISDNFTNNNQGLTIGNFSNQLSGNASQNYSLGIAQTATNENIACTTILFLAANPLSTAKLHLDSELREIDESLKRSKQRDQFNLVSKGAVRVCDFCRAILEVQPKIIHFSGHGANTDGLILENDEGNAATLMTNKEIAAYFEVFAEEGIECVLLNACYSKSQAMAIRQHIPYVIGMNQRISDQAGIRFSVSFYDSLGAGKDIKFSFQFAKTQLIPLGEHKIPELLS